MRSRPRPRAGLLLPLLPALLQAACASGAGDRASAEGQALRAQVERLEARVRKLEESQQRGAMLWGGPMETTPPPSQAPPPGEGATAPSAVSPAAPAAAAPAAPAAPPAASAPAASPERALLLGTIALSGPYAAVPGRGVALLQPLSGKAPAARPRRARMEQRDRDFAPPLLALPVGSTVSFPNGDPVYHNVFSLSPTKKFDLGVYKKGEARDVTFDEAGVVHVLCNLHASMSAYIIVHDEPYAAPLDRGGRFGFRELPPGRYRLRLWHERAGEIAQRQVTLTAGQNRLQVALVADQAPKVPPNKEGKPRGARTAP